MKIERLQRGFFCIIMIAFLMPVGLVGAVEKKPVRITSEDVEQAIDLKAREEAVVTKEKALVERERELALVEKDINEKLAKVQELQNSIKKQLEELNAVPGKEFKNLIKVYSAMSASKVAPLLDKMSVDEATQILRAMKTDAVAKIIPKLEPNKAVAVSKKLGMIVLDR